MALQGANEDGILRISVSGYSALIDGILIAMLGSAVVFLTVLEIQKWIVIQGLMDEISSRYRIPGFNPRIALYLDGHEEMTPAIPLLPYSFLKEWVPIRQFASLLTITVILGALAPLPYMALSFFEVGLDRLELSSGINLDNILSLSLLIFLLASPLFLFLSNIPVPMKRNIEAIRWGFLFPHGRYKIHPKTADWLSEK
ncbi:hypothetical protein DC363_08340 [Thalassorhabdomicrobium marinisediminis]|uniref:Uncharacterized protein n=2 Tax=Thalassorhabdomicrobium marinisediminis TaxID=2170577 RepID=A0A2T7FWN0_9RHOB|nr:hypothetical protein DC363_08340 [Thalassorhabdomicrobium marinisediminis]